MASVSAKIPLDNFTQNGDTTLQQLSDAVAAVNGGSAPGVANPVRDPATGKLIQVVLTFPDTVSAQAINAINANPGVPTTVVEIPEPLVLADLDSLAGIASTVGLGGNDLNFITAYHGAAPDYRPRTTLGTLKGAAGYVDGTIAVSGQALLEFYQWTGGGAPAVSISPGDTVTLTTEGGAVHVFTFTQAWTLDGNPDSLLAWLAADGRMYVTYAQSDERLVPLLFGYEDAVQRGILA